MFKPIPGRASVSCMSSGCQDRPTAGSPIAAPGAADLLKRDVDGAWLLPEGRRDRLYLHPRTTPPTGAGIEVEAICCPDVVLEEYSNTTTYQ